MTSALDLADDGGKGGKAVPVRNAELMAVRMNAPVEDGTRLGISVDAATRSESLNRKKESHGTNCCS